jgi:hypothetical protein
MNGESYYTVDSLIDNGWSEDLFLKQLCFSCITGSSKRHFPFDQEFSVDAYCVALVTNGSARITIDMRAVELQDGCVVLLSPTSVLRIESIDTVFAAVLLFSAALGVNASPTTAAMWRLKTEQTPSVGIQALYFLNSCATRFSFSLPIRRATIPIARGSW